MKVPAAPATDVVGAAGADASGPFAGHNVRVPGPSSPVFNQVSSILTSVTSSYRNSQGMPIFVYITFGGGWYVYMLEGAAILSRTQTAICSLKRIY